MRFPNAPPAAPRPFELRAVKEVSMQDFRPGLRVDASPDHQRMTVGRLADRAAFHTSPQSVQRQ
jgi:hypothetical protein